MPYDAAARPPAVPKACVGGHATCLRLVYPNKQMGLDSRLVAINTKKNFAVKLSTQDSLGRGHIVALEWCGTLLYAHGLGTIATVLGNNRAQVVSGSI